jgi:hypothetical protein
MPASIIGSAIVESAPAPFRKFRESPTRMSRTLA